MPVTSTGVTDETKVPSPSWPDEFRPQQVTLLLARSAQLWKRPAVIRVAELIPLTVTGNTVEEGEAPAPGGTKPKVVKLPNWPFSFSPQHLTVLSLAMIAQEWSSPAATALVRVVIPFTVIGVLEVVSTVEGKAMTVHAEPSWPEKLSPQHLTLVPGEVTDTQVWLPPAAIFTADATEVTITGTFDLPPDKSEAVPSCSSLLEPQHRTVPSESNAQV